jgi:hypothetical protein
VAIAAEGEAIKVTTGTKKANQPTKATRSFVTKKNARRALVTIAKEVSGYRSDLKVRAAAADELRCSPGPQRARRRSLPPPRLGAGRCRGRRRPWWWAVPRPKRAERPPAPPASGGLASPAAECSSPGTGWAREQW